MTNQLPDGTIIRRRKCRACTYRWYTQQPAEIQISKFLLQWSNKQIISICNHSDPV